MDRLDHAHPLQNLGVLVCVRIQRLLEPVAVMVAVLGHPAARHGGVYPGLAADFGHGRSGILGQLDGIQNHLGRGGEDPFFPAVFIGNFS